MTSKLKKAVIAGKAVVHENKNKPLVSFRFDDGQPSDYTEGFPRLKAAGLKGTHCVISSLIDTTGKLTTAEIREISDSGHEIASHSKTHQHLTELTDADMLTELIDSKMAIESITGKKCSSFAVPYGYYDNRVDKFCHGVYENITVSRDYYAVYNPYGKLKNFPATFIDNMTFERCKVFIDHAIENKAWLILGLHTLIDLPVDELAGSQTSIDVFENVIAYLEPLLDNESIMAVTINEGANIVRGGFSMDIQKNIDLDYAL